MGRINSLLYYEIIIPQLTEFCQERLRPPWVIINMHTKLQTEKAPVFIGAFKLSHKMLFSFMWYNFVFFADIIRNGASLSQNTFARVFQYT